MACSAEENFLHREWNFSVQTSVLSTRSTDMVDLDSQAYIYRVHTLTLSLYIYLIFEAKEEIVPQYQAHSSREPRNFL